MAQYYGDDDDCPDPNDVALFAEMHFDRVDLTTRFDLSDGPEPHQRKDEVRLLLDVLGNPSRMTQLLVMRACATPELLVDEMTDLVMKPNGVRSSSHRVPILGEFGKKFPIRVQDPRWLGFRRILSTAKAKDELGAALPHLARNGLDALVNWADEIAQEAQRFLSSQSTNGTWPAFPESWRRWLRFVELDPGLTKAFYLQAKRYFRDDGNREDLVAMIREEAFLTGICNAERRHKKSDDLRGGILGQALRSSARRSVDAILDRSGMPGSTGEAGAPKRVQRVALADENWNGIPACSEGDEWARRIAQELKLECSDIEWVIWDCHVNGMKAPDIVAALQPIVRGYEQVAEALEEEHLEWKQRDAAAPPLPDEMETLLDFSTLAAAMRDEAQQLRLDAKGVRDIIDKLRRKGNDIL